MLYHYFNGGEKAPFQRGLCIHGSIDSKSFCGVRHHVTHDVNYLRREAGNAMAVAQPKQEKESDDCSLLPLVHDIIKW